MYCPRCNRRYASDHRFCPYDGAALTDGPSIERLPSRPTRHSGVRLGGRYDVRGFIGKGAMARVYLAEDTLTHKPVAVKILTVPSPKQEGSSATARFLREAEAAAKIAHPNVAEIYDVGACEDGTPYIVMEFLFGESLGDLLNRAVRLGADLALPILRQVAAGLGAAHAVGIVHRDVKPDNVFLVGEPGEPYAVKVLDFGLAKFDALAGMTAPGIAVGTLEYMAPEQILSDDPDARTDVYGLGIVMYRMCTGTLPFAAKDDADLLAEQLLRPPEPPSLRAPGIDASLEAVILMALHKQPSNRYASMAALLEDLERLSGERSGPVAALTLSREPDVYEPRSAVARNALAFFRARLDAMPPRRSPVRP